MKDIELTPRQLRYRDELLRNNNGDALYMHSETERFYLILYMAKDSDTRELVAVMMGLYGHHPIYTRPLSKMKDKVMIKGKEVLRFVPATGWDKANEVLNDFCSKIIEKKFDELTESEIQTNIKTAQEAKEQQEKLQAIKEDLNKRFGYGSVSNNLPSR